MKTITQIIVLALGLYFGWTALVALRSGRITIYVRYGRSRYFSRRAKPAAYWTGVCWYLILGAVAVSGFVLLIFVGNH